MCVKEVEKMRACIVLTVVSLVIGSGILAQDIRAIIEPVTREGVDVWLDKDCYEDGETLVIHIKAERDGYLTVYDFTPGGQGTKLFPNPFYPDNRIKGGVEYRIPPAGAPFSIKVDIPSGASAGDEELIWVIVTEEQASLPESGHALSLRRSAWELLSDQGWWAAAVVSFTYGPCGETPPPSGDKYALLVGIDHYEWSELFDLVYAVNEVSLAEEVLADLGYRTKTLTDEEATKAKIKAEIANWLGKAGPSGQAVLVFVGLGYTIEDEPGGDETDGYDELLLTWELPRYGRGIIKDDELVEWVSQLDTRKFCLILDVPFSGAVIQASSKGAEGYQKVTSPYPAHPYAAADGAGSDVVRYFLQRAGTLVVSMEATRRREVLWAPKFGDLGPLSVFGMYIFQALAKGKNVAEEVFEYASQRTQELTEELADRLEEGCPEGYECVMHPVIEANGSPRDFVF